MDTLYRVVAGLDVHQKTVVACVRRTTPEGRVAEETRTYRTVTRDLLAMSDWMTRRGVTHVAMESTGVYWKPVFNVLEGGFEEILLVTLAHVVFLMHARSILIVTLPLPLADSVPWFSRLPAFPYVPSWRLPMFTAGTPR